MYERVTLPLHMTNYFIPTLLLALLTVTFGTASACSCYASATDLPFGELGLLGQRGPGISGPVDAVFLGKVIEVDLDSAGVDSYGYPRVRMRFEVGQFFRGDSVKVVDVYSARGSAACGYWAPVGSEHIIFAGRDTVTGHLYTSHCHSNTDSAYNPKGHQRLLEFLDAISLQRDGSFLFSHMVSQEGEYRNNPFFIKDAEFSVKEGRLHGYWRLSKKDGEVLEEGFYENGKKVGPWITRLMYGGDDYSTYYTQLSVITYQNGIARQIHSATQKSTIAFGDEDFTSPTVEVKITGVKAFEED